MFNIDYYSSYFGFDFGFVFWIKKKLIYGSVSHLNKNDNYFVLFFLNYASFFFHKSICLSICKLKYDAIISLLLIKTSE